MERRPCSAHLYEGPESGRSSRLAELRSGGVDGSVEDQGDSTVLYAVNTPQRQNKLQGVSLRGAWEGRLRPSGRGTSVYRGERRRRRISSSSSGDRSGGEQSPLATPLPGEGSVQESLIIHRGRGAGQWRGQWRQPGVKSFSLVRQQAMHRSVLMQDRGLCPHLRGMHWFVLMQDWGPCPHLR